MPQRSSNNAYTAWWNNTVAPLAGGFCTFTIKRPGRKFKIKSITIDWRLTDATNNTYLNPYTVTTQSIQLQVGVNPTGQISQPFEIVPGGNPPLTNGKQFFFNRSGQWLFNGFWISDELRCQLTWGNTDAVITVTHQITIIFETEESIQWR